MKKIVKSSSPISPIFLALVIPVIGLLIFVNTIRLSNIDIWSVDKSSSIDAQILWQKDLSCLTVGYTTSHGAIAVSNEQVVFHYGCIGLDNQFIALNLQNGELEWKSRGDPSYQVIAIVDGYLFINGDSYVGKFDYEGNVLWESEKFPSRATRGIYVREDRIYAPFETQTNKGFYLLSKETGQIIDTISDENAIVTLNTVIVNRVENNKIEIIGSNRQKTLWVTNMPPSSFAEFDSFEEFGDTLFIYSGQDRIDAFNIYSGEKVWQLQNDYASYPLLTKGHLILYGIDDVVSVLNPKNGKLIGTIKLERQNPSVNENPTSSVALGAYEDILLIAYRNNNELISLRIDFPNIED